MTEQLAGAEPAADAAGGETTATVVVAFFANLVIALAKTVVALITASASMLAESAHSWADTGNQVLLYIADRRSRREADPGHPFGYGREAYVWSMLAAFGLFTAGAVVSVWNGVTKLTEPAGEDVSYTWAYLVLAIAFVFEGISFVKAYRQTRDEARRMQRSVVEHALRTSDPTLRAVFAEDAAALAGLVVAAVGILLHQVTGSPVYDAVGSIIVGILLGAVAIVLINRNRHFLTGQESNRDLRDAVVERLQAMPEVAAVGFLRLEYVGPRQLFLVARVDLAGEPPESTVAYTLRDLEARLEGDPTIVEAVLSLAVPEDVAR